MSKAVIVILTAVVSIAIVLGIIFLPQHLDALTFTVIFKDSKGLTEGDGVYASNTRIGEVIKVELISYNKFAARVKIYPKYREILTSDTCFIIEDDPGMMGKKRLGAYVIDLKAPPIAKGDRIQGVESKAEVLIQKAAKAYKDLVDSEEFKQFSEQLRQRIDDVKSCLGRILPELEKIDDEIKKRYERLINSLESYKEDPSSIISKQEAQLLLEQLLRDLEAIKGSEELSKLKQHLLNLLEMLKKPGIIGND